MSLSLQQYCLQQLKEIEEAGLLRRLRKVEDRMDGGICLDGREVIDFSSNDYLGIALHPAMVSSESPERRRVPSRQSAETFKSVCVRSNILDRRLPSGRAGGPALPKIDEEKLKKFPDRDNSLPSGAAASRLISGNHPFYEPLEKAIAEFKQTEDALVFSSGYAAAIGTIPALVGEGDFIVMDKLCHACLVDGAKLSGATLRVYPHLNLKRCEELLKLSREKAGAKGRVLLITESLFSMDGDIAPLADLVVLKKKHGAWLMVDEAHATGVLGPTGRGAAEHFGVTPEIDVSMGTLSKALGSVGGFICGSKELKHLLVNKARSLIFSTGLPPSVCQQALQALHICQNEPEWRHRLWSHVRTMEAWRVLRIKSGAKLSSIPIQSPILPILMGDEKQTLKVSNDLLDAGMFVPAVRFPTVARGKARLRISLGARHSDAQIEALMEGLVKVI